MTLSKKIGQEWSDLQTSNPARVEELQAQAKAESAKYDREYREWYFARTPAERATVEKATGKRIRFPGGRAKYRRDLRDRPGNPGRPTSSFFEFLRSLQPGLLQTPDIANKEGILKYQEMAKIAAERWRAMSTEEKDVSLRLGEGVD
jgi:hypothetical protein